MLHDFKRYLQTSINILSNFKFHSKMSLPVSGIVHVSSEFTGLVLILSYIVGISSAILISLVS